MAFTSEDYALMARALRLAENGLFSTTPNPRVGCVLHKNEKIVGEGWHIAAGGPHAEVHALRQAGEAARGATAYVTLEPCSHHGRTPPCAQALIDAGVARVIAALTDPFPAVAGRGLAMLNAAGIPTETGLLAEQARQLNKGFLSRVERGRPWVTIKTGSSLDGKTALLNVQSQWITGEAARADVQRLRARSCAILTGSGTVITDNPRMNVRAWADARQPRRIVLDSRLRTSPDSLIYGNSGGVTTLATLIDDPARQQPYLDKQAEIWVLPADNGHIDLQALLQKLAESGISELMVEAGATLNGALLAAGLVDEIVMYVAPSLIGHQAQGLFNWPPLTMLNQQLRWHYQDMRRVGDDLRLTLCPVTDISQ